MVVINVSTGNKIAAYVPMHNIDFSAHIEVITGVYKNGPYL